MRAVVQTVSTASVTVGDETVGEITDGLLVLVGVSTDDSVDEAAWIADKIWTLRILDDERSASDVAAPILVISQFTLYADTRKGRRPSWNKAAPGPVAEPLVEAVVERLRTLGATVETGRFGASMLVHSVNVGPRTILLER
ncbi:D-aminoacyl-tRNA deacylase [Stackebrandtia soli]|uniref:D-aminoacyl-tRNA deacylase n=1 Tax=Stackebrandtia soli TaxID=1892856 RepID=UPI0039EAD8C5